MESFAHPGYGKAVDQQLGTVLASDGTNSQRLYLTEPHSTMGCSSAAGPRANREVAKPQHLTKGCLGANP